MEPSTSLPYPDKATTPPASRPAAAMPPAPSIEELYRICVESSPYGIMVHDPQGRILLFNSRLEEISGYSREEIPDVAAWIDAVYPDPVYRELVLRSRGEISPDGGVRVRKTMITRKGGERRLCRFASAFYPGSLRVVFIRDIHEAAEALGTPTPALRNYDFDRSPDPVPVLTWQHTGSDFILVGYNHAAEEALGLPLDRYLASRAAELYGHQPDIVEDLHRCLAARSPIRRRFAPSPADPAQGRIFEALFNYKAPDIVALWLLSPSSEPDLDGIIPMVESERRRIEAALRASDRKFSLAFHASPGGFAITTFEDGRYIDVNAAECRMTGYRREELIGRSVFELGIWADPEDGRRLRALLLEQGVIENYEYRFRRKDGEIRTGIVMSALIDIDGERCIISESIDLTDLRRAQEAVQVSEERLRMATEGAGLALWDWDLRTGVVYCNDLYYRLLGYEPGEIDISFATWMSLLHPEDREAACAKAQKALVEGAELYCSEYRLRTKNGAYRWVHDLGRAVQRDAAGRPTRALGIHVDITARKQTEEALRRARDELERQVHAVRLSEERLRLATEGAGLALWDWDLTADTLYCNDLYYRMLGYEPGEFTPSFESWLEMIHPDDRQKVVQATAEALGSSVLESGIEYRIRHKDGSYRWVNDLGRVVEHDAAGRPTRAIGVHVDITLRKQTEEALRRARDELERHVQERTRELLKSNRSLKQQIERRRRVERDLRAKEKQLERRTADLLEVNAALKVLLRQREEDRREIEERIQSRLKSLVLPYVEKLKRTARTERERSHLGIVELHLRSIAAPTADGVSDKLYRLTPAEIQVAELIKSGKANKEIAATLGVAVKTVEFHRFSIRRKMGLLNKRINLRSFLLAAK